MTSKHKLGPQEQAGRQKQCQARLHPVEEVESTMSKGLWANSGLIKPIFNNEELQSVDRI